MSLRPGYERRWETRRGSGGGRTAADAARDDYYGVPAIHGPHWKWSIILYFFLGGIAGMAYALAAIADLMSGGANQHIARAGRYLSFAALVPSPFLLIWDLGRPERFFHMLYVLKVRSPMSVGTWTLTLFGPVCALAALAQAASDGLLGGSRLARIAGAMPRRALGVAGIVPAFFLAGYTGVLLGATAVPLWAKNALLMGPAFLLSSAASATAALALILAVARPRDRRAAEQSERALARLERLDVLAGLAEAALLFVMQRRLGPVVGLPLAHGRLAGVYRLGVHGLGFAVPALLQATAILRGQPLPRGGTILASLATLAGGFLFRYVMVMAGRASADDPHATFELAKALPRGDADGSAPAATRLPE